MSRTRPLPVALLALISLSSCQEATSLYDLDEDGSLDADDCAPSDPLIHPAADDPYGDGIDQNCDGTDGDASDLDNDGAPNETDCGPDDSTIHPGADDPYGDGIDQDCDGGDGIDLDGDGYTLSLRDCDDNDPTMHIGNYEVRSASVVSSDFNTVHLFAGDVTSLNSTMEQADARRVVNLVEFDLQKDRMGWSFADLWEEFDVPPQLQATELPVLEASYAKQPEIGKLWFEALDETGAEVPNDFCLSGFGFDTTCGSPWEEGNTHLWQDLGESAPAGKTNELSGTISAIEADSWAGDNDGYWAEREILRFAQLYARA